jgi:hypothetical protein
MVGISQPRHWRLKLPPKQHIQKFIWTNQALKSDNQCMMQSLLPTTAGSTWLIWPVTSKTITEVEMVRVTAPENEAAPVTIKVQRLVQEVHIMTIKKRLQGVKLNSNFFILHHVVKMWLLHYDSVTLWYYWQYLLTPDNLPTTA